MILPFAAMLNSRSFVRSAKPGYVAVRFDLLTQYLKSDIGKIHVDEEWYLRTYPDVGAAVAQAAFSSAKQHYALCGYYEHRMPYPIQVIDTWYLAANEDVRQAIADGTFRNAQAHFQELGYREGRTPYPDFELRAA